MCSQLERCCNSHSARISWRNLSHGATCEERGAMAEPNPANQQLNSAAEAPRTAPGVLATFIRRALEAAGLPPSDAEQVADLMVEADLRGSDTHGVIRLPLYVRRLRAGGINKRP